MDTRLSELLIRIGDQYRGSILPGSRHYLEVSIAKEAQKFGYHDLVDRYRNSFVIVPLRSPREGMKVRIDGRTFVNYAQYETGVAVPGYVAREAGVPFKTFVPNDSMICNYA